MYNVYEGRTVRIRPFNNWDEYKAMYLEQGIELNPHWGSWFGPIEQGEDEFKETGALGTGGYSATVVERLDTGELVGYEEYGIDLPASPTAWFGTYILRQHQGQRFGVEAKQLMYCYLFENFPLLKLYSDTVETHAGAARGLKLSGMHYEGRHSRRVVQGGRYVDTVCYGLFREQWVQMPYRHKVKRSAYRYPAALAADSKG